MKSEFSYGILIVLGLLLCTGFFLRIWKLDESSLWIDEGYTLNAAQETAVHEYPLLPSGKIYTNGLLTTYLTAFILKIVPFDPYFPWAPRLPAVLFGTGMVALIFFFAKSLFKDQYLAFVVAFITVFSEWEIAWSRQVRGYAALSFFLILLLFFLWRFLETSKKRYAILAIFSLVFAVLSHNSGLIFIPSTIIFFIVYRFFDQSLSLKRKISVISIIMTFMVAISVFIFHFFSIRGGASVFGYFGLFTNELIVFSIGTLVAFALGIFQKEYPRQVFFLCLFLFVPFVYIILCAPTVQFRYIFSLFPLMIILTSFSLSHILHKIFTGVSHAKKEAIVFLLIILFALPSLSFLPRNFYELEHGSPQPNFKEVFRFIQKTGTKDDVVISPYAHMNKIFLGQNGYWLKVSINGVPKDFKELTVNGRDYYVGAPIVEDLADLKQVISKKHGFVLVNLTVKVRASDEYTFLYTSPKFHMVYRSFAPNHSDFIELYRF